MLHCNESELEVMVNCFGVFFFLVGRIRANVTKTFIACGHGRASGNSGNASDNSLLPPPFTLLKGWVQPEPTGDKRLGRV